MRDAIRFLFGDTVRHLRDVSPTLTVLEYLRTVAFACGTKEGCAEGDCGACTVVLGEAVGGTMRYRAINACIAFVPVLDGRQLLTVEHLQAADGSLHPVQQAMVTHHATQCGFCTPGCVMSLFALHHAGGAADHASANAALAGNLCRCTGYRPIVQAALASCAALPVDAFAAHAADTAARLLALDDGIMLAIRHAGQSYLAPRTVDELTDALATEPGATLLAGGTDIGLWVTKQHRALPSLIALEAITALRCIATTPDMLQIGAMAPYEDVLDAIANPYPDFADLLRRVGSRQIRNRGTLGGNIANASPIGDTAPVLIALGASLVLRMGRRQRTLPVEAFFAGYRQTVLSAGELIERIDLPMPRVGQHLRCYKVAKRFDQDISAVCAAFSLSLEDGVVTDIRIGYGGMAATPVRTIAVEQALRGRPWTKPNIRAAMAVLDAELAPISDFRASAAYRRQIAGNLLFKAWLETTTTTRTRLAATA